jgi:RNA polymerase sigma-70 factor (ECF subfamily)
MTDLTQPTHAVAFSIEDEAALVDRVKAGDQVACAKLVALFGPQMMTVARRFMRCDDDCDDAVQEAFISAFNALARFEADSRLSTWLHRITVNCCLMKLRIDSSRKETSIEELLPIFDERGYRGRWPVAMNDPSTEVEIHETHTMVLQAIGKLPQADRAVLVLRDIEEMDTAATAARLETSEHNVKRRLRRARLVLCTRLEPMMFGERSLATVA